MRDLASFLIYTTRKHIYPLLDGKAPLLASALYLPSQLFYHKGNGNSFKWVKSLQPGKTTQLSKTAVRMLRRTGLGVTGNPATYSDYFNGDFFRPIETALCDISLKLISPTATGGSVTRNLLCPLNISQDLVGKNSTFTNCEENHH